MKALLCVDIGTTSLRVVLHDARGRVRHLAQRHCAPDYLDDGRVEQDPHTWRSGLVELLAEGAQAAQRLGAEPLGLALTAQRSSVIAVDAQGRPLHPALMWQDTRSAALAQAIGHEHDAAVYRKTGLKVSPVFSAVKMAWLARHRPAVWAATHKLLGVQDWAVWLLTGRYATDHTFGSRTNLMNLQRRDWDDELLSLFNVPRERLCELVPPGSVVGGLLPAMAAATGLVAGLPVVSAGGDQQCAALGLGLVGPGRAVANIGTGSYLIGHADAPVFDEAMRVACNVAALPGACIVEASILSAGAVHRWFAELTAGEGDLERSFARLEAEAAQAPPGANGVVVVPHFRGAGTPHWDPLARGAIVGLGLGTTRGEIARALLEGIAAELRGGLDVVEPLVAPVAEVHAAGGMTRSALFDQLLADALQRPVRCFGTAEATARGAWMAAAVALGLAASHADAFAGLHADAFAVMQAGDDGAAEGAGEGAADTPRCFQPDPAGAQVAAALRARALNIHRALAAPGTRAS